MGSQSVEEFDYIIVGAGSAGSVLAKRLTENGSATACVIEAGPNDWHPYIHIPAGYVKNLNSPVLTWGFVSEPVPGADGRAITLPQGKAVGGSSSINGMVYNRGQDADYNGWAQRGNAGWSYDDVLPYFKRSEQRLGSGDDAYRGRSGPLTVTNSVIEHPLCARFVEAAKELGVIEIEEYNGAKQDGTGRFQYTIDRSGFRTLRMSAARAFLHPAEKTGRVSVRTSSHVSRILFEGRRAVGVQYLAGGFNGPLTEVRARREVIISAGALNTPRLLQISGIGNPEHLGSIGVDVVAPLSGVGENLTDHYQMRVAAAVKNIRTLNERARGIPLLWEITKWLAGAPSIVGMGPGLMRAFMRSDPALETPDLQLWFTPASFKEGVAGFIDHYPGMSCGGYRQRPDSRGWVRAASKDIAVAPKIQPNYLSTESDRVLTVTFIKMARRILMSSSLAPYFDRETFPGPDVRTDDEILAAARKYGSTSFHHIGTARMGKSDDPGAVVDNRLRVHTLDRLRVVDASIMPTITSGNTNAPTIMIAEKAADMIKADN